VPDLRIGACFSLPPSLQSLRGPSVLAFPRCDSVLRPRRRALALRLLPTRDDVDVVPRRRWKPAGNIHLCFFEAQEASVTSSAAADPVHHHLASMSCQPSGRGRRHSARRHTSIDEGFANLHVMERLQMLVAQYLHATLHLPGPSSQARVWSYGGARSVLRWLNTQQHVKST